MFYQEQQGNYLYAQVGQLASDIESLLHKLFNIENIKITGSFARQSEKLTSSNLLLHFLKKTSLIKFLLSTSLNLFCINTMEELK